MAALTEKIDIFLQEFPMNHSGSIPEWFNQTMLQPLTFIASPQINSSSTHDTSHTESSTPGNPTIDSIDPDQISVASTIKALTELSNFLFATVNLCGASYNQENNSLAQYQTLQEQYATAEGASREDTIHERVWVYSNQAELFNDRKWNRSDCLDEAHGAYFVLRSLVNSGVAISVEEIGKIEEIIDRLWHVKDEFYESLEARYD